MKRKKDWVGAWFDLLANRGIQTDVLLGSCEGETNQITSFKRYSHSQFDGVGVILDHYRNSGFAPTVPTLSKTFFGSWLSKIGGLIANLRFVPVFGAEWKQMSDPFFGRGFALKPDAKDLFVYRVLSKEISQEIFTAAKSQAVSINSQLMWSLDQTLRSNWKLHPEHFFWMVPVNMRGAIQKQIDTSNHASWIWVDTFKAQKAAVIQNQIQARLNEGFHWGAWLGLNIGKLIGIKGMNFLLDKAAGIEEHWVGTFSNVGAWTIDGAGPVAIIIPTAPSTPLSAGCVTVNGNLGLSLHVHPQLNVDEITLGSWIDSWVEKAKGL